MQQGEVPDDLPSIETFECRVCNVSVKYLREHLKNVHKITEAEYEELFKDELLKKESDDHVINDSKEHLTINTRLKDFHNLIRFELNCVYLSYL